jgi:hypothetical protein
MATIANMTCCSWGVSEASPMTWQQTKHDMLECE